MKTKLIFLFFAIFFFSVGIFIWFKLKKKKSFNRNPWSISKGYPIRGIDLSHHNGKINYDALDTLDFVFLKASEGNNIIDELFEIHYDSFQKKDKVIGAYHFFRFDIDGTLQARHFLNQLNGKEFQLPVVIDIEHENNPTIAKNIVIEQLNKFILEVKKQIDIKPIIYTNGIGYQEFIKDKFNDYDIWLSSTNSWRPSMTPCTFWQFNIEANIDGINHQVDLNVFRGSKDEWEKYLIENKP